MNFFGLQIDRSGVRFRKAAVLPTTVPAAAIGSGGFWGVIRESFAGAWQRNVEVDATEGLLAFSAVYACLDLISKDISKLRPMLVTLTKGVWVESNSPAFSPVLRKPNGYQTRIQFLSTWVLSKLIHGNTYVLKQRDARGIVTDLHVLNARMVRAMVTEDGGVYYQLSYDKLAQIGSVMVPASEIIHDRGACLFHPLVGIPPIYACAMSASQGNRIQNNSAKFFENMSRPSGMLTAPGTITDDTADRLKAQFETNFSGANLGKLLVAGDDLKYEPMTIPAQQAQLIEQLQWTVQDVARCFHVPLHKIASDTGIKYANMAEMNQDYYSQCLQCLIEDIEVLLDEGLGLSADGAPQTMGVELDLEVLMRMDPVQRATRNETAVKGGYWSPNEARATDGLLPVTGGEEPYMQQQNFPLSLLAKQKVPGSTPPAPPALPPAPAPDPNAVAPPAPASPPADGAKSIEATLAAIDRLSGDMRVLRDNQLSMDEVERRHAERLTQTQAIADELRAENEELVRQKALASEALALKELAAADEAALLLEQETEAFANELISRFTADES